MIRLKNTPFLFCASCIAYNRLQYVFLWPLPLPFILKENVWEMFVYLLDSDIWHESLWIQEKWSSCMLNVTWSIYKIQRNAIMWVHLIFHCYSEKVLIQQCSCWRYTILGHETVSKTALSFSDIWYMFVCWLDCKESANFNQLWLQRCILTLHTTKK